jgi:hypothetical protein
VREEADGGGEDVLTELAHSRMIGRSGE